MPYLTKLSVSLLLLFQLSLGYSQNMSMGIHSINVFFKYTMTEPDTPEKTFVSNNLYYPYCELKWPGNPIILPTIDKKAFFQSDVSCLTLIIGPQWVFVSPGDTIEYTFRNKKFTLIGKEERYQNFEQNKRIEFDSKNEYPVKKIRELSLLDYKAYCLSYFQKEQEYINNYFLTGHEVIKNYLLNRSKYSLVTYLYDGIKDNQYAKNTVPKDFLTIYDTSLYNHPGIYIDYQYGAAAADYNSFIANTYNDTICSATYFKMIKTAKENFSVPVYDFLLMGYMKLISLWGNSSFNDVAAVINTELKKTRLDSATTAKMDKCYHDFKMLSKNLKDFNQVKLKTIDGRSLRLADVIEKGKFTFIDFWASWCGACIPELPFIHANQEKYPGVKFITLSIDANESAWKASFNKHQLSKSTSFLLADGLKSKIATDYTIQAIPRFLLFDAQGKCISAIDMRPSDPMFHKYIEQFLGSK